MPEREEERNKLDQSISIRFFFLPPILFTLHSNDKFIFNHKFFQLIIKKQIYICTHEPLKNYKRVASIYALKMNYQKKLFYALLSNSPLHNVFLFILFSMFVPLSSHVNMKKKRNAVHKYNQWSKYI